jgi:hypothetical protein
MACWVTGNCFSIPNAEQIKKKKIQLDVDGW